MGLSCKMGVKGEILDMSWSTSIKISFFFLDLEMFVAFFLIVIFCDLFSHPK